MRTFRAQSAEARPKNQPQKTAKRVKNWKETKTKPRITGKRRNQQRTPKWKCEQKNQPNVLKKCRISPSEIG